MIRNVLPRLIEIEKDNLWFYSSYTNNKMGDSRDMNGMIIYYGFIKRGWRENPLQKLEVLMGTSTINSNLMVDCPLPCLISG